MAWGVGVALVLVAAWSVAVALAVVRAQREARAGETAVEGLRDATLDDVLDGSVEPRLVEVREHFAAAGDAIGPFWMAPARSLPVVGRQLRSADALADTAVTLADTGLGAVARTRAAVDDGDLTGAGRVELVETLADVVTDASVALDGVDLGPDEALLAPLADARAQLDTELTDVRASLADAERATTGFAELLRGPSRYVLVAANNAEMRAGSGTWLQAGLLTIDDGDLAVVDLRQSYDRNPPDGAVPIGDADLAALWGWTEPQEEWRNLALSPRLPASADLAARMWEWAEGQPPDGVIVVDPVALALIIDLSGPVPFQGRRVDAAELLDYLLVEQYAVVEAQRDNLARRLAEASLATTVVRRLSAVDVEPRQAIEAMGPAVTGRHLLGWSRNPVVADAFAAVGMDGDLGERSLAVALVNRGGDKLDSFTRLTTRVRSEPTPDGVAVEVTVRVTNDGRDDLPGIILGSHQGDGTYSGFVTVNVPGAARDVRFEGDEVVAAGPDGPTQAISGAVVVPPGQSRERTVRFTLPADAAGIRLEPTARQPETRWRVDGREYDDDGRHEIDLSP